MGKQNIQNEEVHWRKKDDLAAFVLIFFSSYLEKVLQVF